MDFDQRNPSGVSILRGFALRRGLAKDRWRRRIYRAVDGKSANRDALQKSFSSINIEAVKLRGISIEYFLLVLLVDILEVFVDFLPRVWPESRAMGKIR